MKNAESSIIKFCSSIDFGKIILSREEKSFYGLLNSGILRIIKSLPQSVQTAAMLVLTNHLRLPLKRDMDFFSGFYPPVWSILYWLSISFAGDGFFSEEEMQNYYTVHASAMLLHLMDDHLTDGDMPVTHVTLLLRSQLWMVMNRSIADLTKEKNSDLKIINKYIDLYYAGIENSVRPNSLDRYCFIFKQQMGMGYIAPILMTRKMTVDDRLLKAVETLFGAFGTAWRLLDDLQDMVEDMATGAKSSIYICLPESIKQYWERNSGNISDKQKNTGLILNAILELEIIDQVLRRICHELEQAATIAETINIRGIANELYSLAIPLKNASFYEIRS